MNPYRSPGARQSSVERPFRALIIETPGKGLLCILTRLLDTSDNWHWGHGMRQALMQICENASNHQIQYIRKSP